MAVIPMKALLESGVHFGHRTNKWDPRMKPYIFTERNGIHIIDLQQTSKMLSQAYNVIRDAVANGGMVLFVGTKRQAQETVAEEAARCGMPYVTERWMGGMLTNWSTMHARIEELERLEKMRDNTELERLEKMRDNNELDRLTKKEGLLIGRQITRLTTRLSGTRSMKRRPDLIFIIDVGREEAAVHEANLLNIPIVAMVDTNCNPLNIDYVIPSNDDAIRAIKLLVAKVADAVLEGKAMRKEEDEDKPVAETQPRSDKSSRRIPKVVEVDEELQDDALLGEATLAKMNAAREDVPATVTETPAAEKPVETSANVPAETDEAKEG
ncbi:MAG TPA: 30S ribosomal protein S2 [Anaerolineales bacterium]|nr:30S ribosomal protein S2 [Anaerolineales bacterium]